ncbi:MAG: hypothetical protein IH849_12710 [Acidobacteria bacterium]|nr:hypothetical protein [Acidobacteriota bacterium]
MTTDSHASPGDSSTGQLSPALAVTDAVDLDPERRLAAAVFERAAADLEGGHSISSSKRQEMNAGYDALEWAHEAGESFRFWCDVARRDWRDARRAMLRYGRPHLRSHGRWLQRPY